MKNLLADLWTVFDEDNMPTYVCLVSLSLSLPDLQDYLHFHIADVSTRWSALFAAIDELKLRNPGVVEDYTVSETTLEQVFLSFAKKYNNAAKKDNNAAAKLLRTLSRTLSTSSRVESSERL